MAHDAKPENFSGIAPYRDNGASYYFILLKFN